MSEVAEAPIAPPPPVPPVESAIPEAPPPENGTPTLPPTEVQSQPEQGPTKETLGGEINDLGNAIINGKGSAIQEDLKTKPPSEVLASEDRQKLYLVHRINTVAQGENLPFHDPEKPNEDLALPIKVGDETYYILSVQGLNNTELNCKVQVRSGAGVDEAREDKGTLVLKRGDVARAQLIAEKDAILRNFSGKERELLSLYLDAAQNPNILEGHTPTDVQQLIKGAADEMNIPTNDDLEIFHNKVFPDSPLDEGTLTALRQGTIATPELYARILKDPALPIKIARLNEDIADLQIRAEKNPNDKGIATELADAKIIKGLYERFMTNGETLFAEHFNRMLSGQVDRTTMAGIKEAVRRGDASMLLQHVVSELRDAPDATEAEKAENEERRRELLRKLGGMGLIALLLMAMVGSGLAKQATS